MNCPCDRFDFPARLYIPAGLPRLPRQIATFSEFRRALLRDIGMFPVLDEWRGRQGDDFGVMLLEMWAYVCDVVSFYDEVFAHENYVRTSRRRESLCALISLLGYRPRPAVGASVELAAFADGRQAVRLPAGTAFRSDAFAGNAPQVFELTNETVIHAFHNAWTLRAMRPTTFGGSALSLSSLLCALGTVSVKTGDVVLVRVGTMAYARFVTGVTDHDGADGARYRKVEFDEAVPLPANTAVSAVKLLKPTITASLWGLTFDGVAFSEAPAILVGKGGGTTPDAPWADLDSIYRSASAGQDVIYAAGTDLRARKIVGTALHSRVVTKASSTTFTDASGGKITVPIPAATTLVTRLHLDHYLKSELTSTLITVGASKGLDSSPEGAMHLGFVSAGSVTIEARTTLGPNDPLNVPLPLEQPVDAAAPGRFQLEDKNQFGAVVDATLAYTTGILQLGQNSTWEPPLTVPVRLFGNTIAATRGESVRDEWLGFGDATQANQTFTLKKSPLTYLDSPTAGNAIGVANTLKVYVDGVLWDEVPGFFGVPADAQVYIVRENSDGESSVTFGDGVRACRLATGARVTAWYRFGAGAASPPAGGIHQVARPVKGLAGVLNPVAAAAGADAEPVSQIRAYAPRSALLLGRAVSMADFEAATAATSGVRAVRAEWRWNTQRQRPVAQVYYVGDPNLDASITARLRGLTEPDTPIDVSPATPIPRTLAIQVTIDQRYLEADVLAAVRSALMDAETGLLSPERVGIGLPLFRSRIFEFVLRIRGAVAVANVQLDNSPFPGWGLAPGPGQFFDFEKGGVLLLNGQGPSA